MAVENFANLVVFTYDESKATIAQVFGAETSELEEVLQVVVKESRKGNKARTLTEVMIDLYKAKKLPMGVLLTLAARGIEAILERKQQEHLIKDLFNSIAQQISDETEPNDDEEEEDE